jgi:predicted unusual protein kinase regulating ubiquinone biosynthesis (AarF/ABC1/UbiB family)
VRARRLHGDPHPGNFRLLPDGRLVVLDFGATEALPRGWPARLGPFLAAGRDGDAAALHRLAVAVGLAPEDLPPAALADLLGPYFAPLRVPAFAFTRGWLREQTRRVSDPFSEAARIQRRLIVPPRHLLLLRVVAGLVGVLCSLGATVAVDAEVRRWVPGYGSPESSA